MLDLEFSCDVSQQTGLSYWNHQQRELQGCALG